MGGGVKKSGDNLVVFEISIAGCVEETEDAVFVP